MSPEKTREVIQQQLRQLTDHPYLEIVQRGNAAILAALSVLPKSTIVLIPEEGGWLSYKTAPPKLGLEIKEVRCHDAVLDLTDLQHHLEQKKKMALLYQHPGGYFASQPAKDIYALCFRYGCTVILDVSGSIGTPLCDGAYADILVGSFGEWKLVEAKVGGFISCRSKELWEKIAVCAKPLTDEISLARIAQQLINLPKRIAHLQEIRKKIIEDLSSFHILHGHDEGFVVVVAYDHEDEKEKIIGYCLQHQLQYTECPRYIRLNRPAISIEVKRLPAS